MLSLAILCNTTFVIIPYLRQMTMTIARKIESKETEMIFPTGSGWKMVPITDFFSWQRPRYGVSSAHCTAFKLLQAPNAQSMLVLQKSQVMRMSEQLRVARDEESFLRQEVQWTWVVSSGARTK